MQQMLRALVLQQTLKRQLLTRARKYREDGHGEEEAEYSEADSEGGSEPACTTLPCNWGRLPEPASHVGEFHCCNCTPSNLFGCQLGEIVSDDPQQ